MSPYIGSFIYSCLGVEGKKDKKDAEEEPAITTGAIETPVSVGNNEEEKMDTDKPASAK